ncbi:MAG: hypothetical protein NT000_00615 [Proteobacteria bacterium]|nr:hypothetical protein [Pseudomonadota bacterium]
MNQSSQWPLEFINLETYPMLTLGSAQTQSVISQAQQQLKLSGAAEMPLFLNPLGIARLIQESLPLAEAAFWNALTGNAYLEEPDKNLPADHVRKIFEPTSLGAVGYDQFPVDNLLRKIYEWEPFMNFIQQILNLPKLYRYADPMGALNLSVMKENDYLRWHFDQTDFVTSLSVRNSEKGGEFEYAPRIRGPEKENYEKVQKVIKGESNEVVNIPNRPGTLLIFQGRYSLHRVTQIKGKTSRLMGLLGYAAEPNIMSTEYLRKIRYGRTAPLKEMK